MSNSNLILLVVLVVVFAIIVFSYLHKRHHEYKMADIEKILSSPGPDDDIMELTRDYLECKRDLDAKTEEWGELMEV